MSILSRFKAFFPSGKQEIPIFPLHAVLFPAGILSLKIFEQRYIEMTKECLKNDHYFGISLIQDGQETGAAAIPEAIGCIAKIAEWDMGQSNLLQIRAIGLDRFKLIDSKVNDKNLIVGHIDLIPPETDMPIPERYEACVGLLRKIIATNDIKAFVEPIKLDSASWVGHRLAELLPLKLSAKQKLMELSDPLIRLDVLAKFLIQKKLI